MGEITQISQEGPFLDNIENYTFLAFSFPKSLIFRPFCFPKAEFHHSTFHFHAFLISTFKVGLSHFLLSESGKHQSTALEQSLIYIVSYNWFYCSNVRIKIKEESWKAGKWKVESMKALP